MWMRSAGLIWQDQHSGRTQVKIHLGKRSLVIRCEVVGQGQSVRCLRQLQHTGTEVLSSHICIKPALARFRIDIPGTSAVSPAPLCQIDDRPLTGEVSNAPTCWSVSASYASTQP